jgi:hypothetical protein
MWKYIWRRWAAYATPLQPNNRQLRGRDSNYEDEFASIFSNQIQHCTFPAEIQTNVSMIIRISAHKDGAKCASGL